MNSSKLVKKITILILVCLSFLGTKAFTQNNDQRLLMLDMVHHNPGEAPYVTKYNDPEVIKDMGYNGKVYFLFESPALAINWESVSKDILPKGSDDRKWVDKKAAKIKKMHADNKAQGMKIYAMSDLVLFPKRLIEKYQIQETFGDPNNPLTEKFIRAQINEMFDQFPDLDGLVVRIGETYLHDAPYHLGAIKSRKNAEETIIPLMNILREEICVKRNRKLIFRTWRAFDINLNRYMTVNDAIEPHKNLIISVKHVEGDFHRANSFSKVIGQGRHPQIIEVQSSREYEGKGAYPNYIANGVINGFEEHRMMAKERINSIQKFANTKPELYAGIWTWSRGGGWNGPYIKDELWSDLNSWVMVQWAKDPTQSEASIFNRYAIEKLNLVGNDITKFRELCLLSAEAVIRGRSSTYRDMNPWWTRDQGIGWPMVVKGDLEQKRNLTQKDESIAKWEKIVKLAKSINWANPETKSHAIGSAEYGLRLYKIYRALIYMKYADDHGNIKDIKKWIKEYDIAWENYNKLPKTYNNIATLYTQDYKRHIANVASVKVNELRELVEAKSSN